MGARIKDAASVVQTLAGNLVGEPGGCWFYAPGGKMSTRTSPQFYVGITRYVQVRKFLLELRTGKKATADVFSACANISCVAPHHAVERVVKRRPGGDYSHLLPENTRQKRFWKYVHKQTEGDQHWIWKGTRLAAGYGYFVWKRSTNKSGREMIVAHRASLLLHGVEIPEGLIACHRCGVKPCVNPAHLRVGTYADNAAEAIQHQAWTCRNPRRGRRGPERQKKREFPIIFRIALQCEHCAAIYIRNRSTIAGGTSTRHCSRSCMWAAKRIRMATGGPKYLGPNVEYQKAARLKIKRKPVHIMRRKTERTALFKDIPCAYGYEDFGDSGRQKP